MIPLITLISLLVVFVVYKIINYSIRKPHLKNIYDSYNECHKYIEKFLNFEFENISADVPKEIGYGIFCARQIFEKLSSEFLTMIECTDFESFNFKKLVEFSEKSQAELLKVEESYSKFNVFVFFNHLKFKK
jgi:hypothetical protein